MTPFENNALALLCAIAGAQAQTMQFLSRSLGKETQEAALKQQEQINLLVNQVMQQIGSNTAS